jgi:hypothetical protein
MRVRVLVGAALALVLAAVAVALSESKERLAGTNDLRAAEFVATLPAGARACQAGEFVPGDGARLRLLVGTYERPVPPLEVEIRSPAGSRLRGKLPGGAREGYVEVPLERTTTPVSGATVCVRNGGDHRIVIAGFRTSRRVVAVVGGRRARGNMRFEYMRPGRESWWALAPTVAHRFGLGKAGFMGDWTLAAAAVLLLLAWIAAIRLLVTPRLP